MHCSFEAHWKAKLLFSLPKTVHRWMLLNSSLSLPDWTALRMKKIRGDLDRDLHLKIAQISDNPLILSVLNASAQITENMIVGIRSYLMQKNNDAPEIDSQHTRLVQAITNNDSPLAEKVMNEHMHTIEYLLNEITSDNLTISDNVQQP